MNDVVERRKYHQHYDNREADPEPHFLGSFRQGTPANRLDSVEQKVTAIQERYREEVEKPDRNRKHRRQVNQIGESERSDLPRDLRDANRPAQLIGRLMANDDPADIAQGLVDDEPGL